MATTRWKVWGVDRGTGEKWDGVTFPSVIPHVLSSLIAISLHNVKKWIWLSYVNKLGINMLPCTAFSLNLGQFKHLWDKLGRAERQCHPQPHTHGHLKADSRNIQVRMQRIILYAEKMRCMCFMQINCSLYVL